MAQLIDGLYGTPAAAKQADKQRRRAAKQDPATDTGTSLRPWGALGAAAGAATGQSAAQERKQKYGRDGLRLLTPYTYELPTPSWPTSPAASEADSPKTTRDSEKSETPWQFDRVLENLTRIPEEDRDDWRLERIAKNVADRQTEAAGGPETRTVRRRAKRLSWEEYEALSPDQRAAVDFNTLLVQAREKDLRRQEDYNPSAVERDAYNRAVTQMFGEDGASETYAPEVMGLLRDIDFRATDQTLEDFLTLNAAVGVKDLKDFTIDTEGKSVRYQDGTVTASGGLEGVEQLAINTARMQQTMVETNQILQNFRATARAARNDDLELFGGIPNKVKARPGFGLTDLTPAQDDEARARDEYFMTAFDMLSRKLTPAEEQAMWREEILPTLEGAGDLDEFLRFLDLRSRQARDYRAPLAPGEGRDSAENFRKRMGLD